MKNCYYDPTTAGAVRLSADTPRAAKNPPQSHNPGARLPCANVEALVRWRFFNRRESCHCTARPDHLFPSVGDPPLPATPSHAPPDLVQLPQAPRTPGDDDDPWQPSPVSRPAKLVLSCGPVAASCIMPPTVHQCPRVSHTAGGQQDVRGGSADYNGCNRPCGSAGTARTASRRAPRCLTVRAMWSRVCDRLRCVGPGQGPRWPASPSPARAAPTGPPRGLGNGARALHETSMWSVSTQPTQTSSPGQWAIGAPRAVARSSAAAPGQPLGVSR